MFASNPFVSPEFKRSKFVILIMTTIIKLRDLRCAIGAHLVQIIARFATLNAYKTWSDPRFVHLLNVAFRHVFLDSTEEITA